LGYTGDGGREKNIAMNTRTVGFILLLVSFGYIIPGFFLFLFIPSIFDRSFFYYFLLLGLSFVPFATFCLAYDKDKHFIVIIFETMFLCVGVSICYFLWLLFLMAMLVITVIVGLDIFGFPEM
jgi:hypothetical protein